MSKHRFSAIAPVLILAVLAYAGCSSGGGSAPALLPVKPPPPPTSASTTVPLATNTALPIPAIGGFAGTLTEAANNAPAGTTVTLTSYSVAPNTAPAPQSISHKALVREARAHLLAASPTAIFWASQQYSAAVTFATFPVIALQVPTTDGGTPLALEMIDSTTNTLLDVEFATSTLNVATFQGSATTFSAVPGHTYWLELVTGKPTPQPEFVYVANFQSDNVSAYTVDQTTGGLTAVAGSPFATAQAPWAPTVDPSGKFVYVADNNVGSGPSDVSAYTIDAATGGLTAVTGSPFTADHGCGFAAVDPSTKFAYVSCYDNSMLVEYTIAASGALTTIGTVHTIPQPGPGASDVIVDPTGRFVYVPNNASSGGGSVSAYTIDASTGALTTVTGSPFASSSTAITAAIDPSGKYVYATNGGSNVVSGYAVDAATGALTPIPGSPFSAGPNTIGVAVDPLDRFVYVTNFDANNVSAYTINLSTGALTLVGTFATGNQPSNVAIEPLGKFLYVTNQADNTVSAFSINSASGALGLIGTYATGANPIGIAVGRVSAAALRSPLRARAR